MISDERRFLRSVGVLLVERLSDLKRKANALVTMHGISLQRGGDNA